MAMSCRAARARPSALSSQESSGAGLSTLPPSVAYPQKGPAVTIALSPDRHPSCGPQSRPGRLARSPPRQCANSVCMPGTRYGYFPGCCLSASQRRLFVFPQAASALRGSGTAVRPPAATRLVLNSRSSNSRIPAYQTFLRLSVQLSTQQSGGQRSSVPSKRSAS